MTPAWDVRPHYRIGKRSVPVVLGGGLIFAGILLLAVARASAPIAPSYAPSPLAVASHSASSSAAPTATRDPRAPIPQGYRIQIPRLGIDLPLAEGDIDRDIDQQHTPE